MTLLTEPLGRLRNVWLGLAHRTRRMIQVGLFILVGSAGAVLLQLTTGPVSTPLILAGAAAVGGTFVLGPLVTDTTFGAPAGPVELEGDRDEQVVPGDNQSDGQVVRELLDSGARAAMNRNDLEDVPDDALQLVRES